MNFLPILFTLLIVSINFASELTYKPVNPSFGGDSYNFQSLMNSATAQNSHKENTTKNNSTLEEFSESLNRQLLSRISQQIISAAFGNDELHAGNFKVGGFNIDVEEKGTMIEIQIFDTVTGESTVLKIPYYKNNK